MQSFGLYGISDNHAVTLWVISDFLECQTNQRVVPCAKAQYRILGMSADVAAMRMARYRLKRQGMLELDAWLAQLEPAFTKPDETLHQAIVQLLQNDTPQLLSMMQKENNIPEILLPWLALKPSQ